MNTVTADASEMWLLELGRHVPDAVKRTATFELEGQTAAFASLAELQEFAARYGYEGKCLHVTQHDITEPLTEKILADPKPIGETASNENSERLKEFAQ